MIQIEYLPIVLTGIGIIVSILYYTMTLRNSNKTRQAQLFMNLYEVYRGMDFRRRWYSTSSWEWSDHDDFLLKYGPDTNVEAFSTFNSILGFFEGVGMLVRRGYVELDLVEDLLDIPADVIWEKFKDIVYASRQKRNWPQLFANYEYLIQELGKRKKIIQ